MARKPATPAADPAAAVRSRLGYVAQEDVAALLGITAPTLRNRLSCGTAPPSYRVGNTHLFKISELDAWIRRRRIDKGSA